MNEVAQNERHKDMMIQSQPILWANGMLDEAEKCEMEDARDAILTRIGMTLMSRFGVNYDPHNMRRADQVWELK